jgi:hypothetical protein
MRPRAIEIRIGELVLEGVSAADRLRIGAAFERELARLVVERGLGELAAGGTLDVVDAGSFVREPRATPASLGAALAGSVHRGIRR